MIAEPQSDRAAQGAWRDASALAAPAPSAAARAHRARARWRRIWAAPATSPAIWRCPPDVSAKALLLTRKPGSIAGLICAEAAFRLLDPSLEFRFEVQDGGDAEAGAHSGHGARRRPQHSHGRTRGAEFRRPAFGRRHGDARTGRCRGRHQGAHRLHAQDHARPAHAGEICRALRRRLQSPLRAGRRRADQGQPYRRGGRDCPRARTRARRRSATW